MREKKTLGGVTFYEVRPFGPQSERVRKVLDESARPCAWCSSSSITSYCECGWRRMNDDEHRFLWERERRWENERWLFARADTARGKLEIWRKRAAG